jgi:2-polyprenyl-3-methyl-5-hydroxy-6-metoxy-1,4-benzoquinol methylase
MNMACRVCGASASLRGTGLAVCAGCGLAWREQPYFGKPVYHAGNERAIYLSAKEELFAGGLSWLERSLPRKGLLLDVGCAGGELLKAAAARGWRGEGVEIDAALAGKASAAGFTVHTDPVEKAGLKKAAYDAAAAFEVFSQMENPSAAAEAIHAALKPGGVIYIREFNAAFHLFLHRLELAGVFKPLGASPAVIHNFNFGARSLRALLERAGFREVSVRNSRPTAGDPYRTGGALGGVLTAGLKVLYYSLAQALYYLSFGRVLAGSSLIVTARK